MIRTTPLVRHGDVALKLENLQRTGSFKLRGAVRKLGAMPQAERNRGVVTASAGNHGAALALVGRELGIPVTVYVPPRTPDVKSARIESMGADVIIAGADYDDAEAVARSVAAQSGRVFVSAFEDDDIMAGNGGSLAEEILSQEPDTRRVLTPVGGGGLVAGLCQVLTRQGIDVIGVQPERNCAMHESLRQGRALTGYTGDSTIAEGCEGAVGARCYEIAAAHGLEVALVSEDAIRDAVAYLYREAGTVAECSGAVAMAAVLSRRVPGAAPGQAGADPRHWWGGPPNPPVARDGVTVVIITGGNIEPAQLDEILARDL